MDRIRITAAIAACACIALAAQSRWESTPFVSAADRYFCCRCPAMVITQRGTVLAFAEGRVNTQSDEGDIDVVLERSTDEGRTWSPLRVLENDGINRCKNPTPVMLPSGRILLAWLWNKDIPSKTARTTREVFATHSNDDGLTWSKSRNITASVSKPGWTWYGTGPGYAIVKTREPHKGRIVIPARHSGRNIRGISHVIYSDDGGETFAEFYVDSALIEPACEGSILFHSLNPKTGKGNILFSKPADRTVRVNGTVKLSEDDGKTWTKSLRYSDPAPRFSGYSDLALTRTGDIAVLYEKGAHFDKKQRYKMVAFTILKLSEFR